MTDVFTKKKRSQIMSLIRAKNTQAEKIVFSHLRKKSIYYQKHYKHAEGRPDIALPSKKKAVFIDGDFWHGRNYARILKSRGAGDYWPNKISSNMKRDKISRKILKGKGWEILTVWESDIKRRRTRDQQLGKIDKFLVGD